jgi:hypothetical protein
MAYLRGILARYSNTSFFRRGRAFPFISAVVLFAIVLAAVVFLLQSRRDRNIIHIAFVGRNTHDPTRTLDRKTLSALRQYLEEVQDEFPELGFEVVPWYVDTVNGPDAGVMYGQIVDDPRIAIAIDNTWGSEMRLASSVIRNAGLPTISLNADKLSAEPGPQTLFLGHADTEPPYIVAFVKEVLRSERVHFVTEADYALRRQFETAFKDKHIHSVLHSLEGKPDPDRVDRLFRDLAHDPQNLPVVLNVHSSWGDMIIKHAESDIENRFTLIAGPSVVSRSTIGNFGKTTGNTFYLITNPMDALPYKIRVDLRRFMQEDPMWEDHANNALYIKRCLDAVEIIRHALKDADVRHVLQSGRNQARQTLARSFAKLRNETLPGHHDLYSFDSEGRLHLEITFIRYARGTRQSNPWQLNTEQKRIPNTVVGIELLSISDLDPASSSFKADFIYWIIEPEGEPRTAVKASNETPTVSFTNLKQAYSDRPLFERRNKDSVYRRRQFSGQFHYNFMLREYPFDVQEPTIQLGLLNPSGPALSASDTSRISFDPTMLDASDRRPDIRTPGWDTLEAPYATVDNRLTTALWGDPEVSDTHPNKSKNAQFWFPLKRSWINPFIVVVLPLALIGTISLILLFVPDLSFSAIGDVAVGVFLSIITYSISYGQLTPASNVLTKADYLFYGTFVIVLASFLWIITANIVFGTDVLRSGGPRGALVYVRGAMVVAYGALVLLIPVSQIQPWLIRMFRAS